MRKMRPNQLPTNAVVAVADWKFRELCTAVTMAEDGGIDQPVLISRWGDTLGGMVKIVQDLGGAANMILPAPAQVESSYLVIPTSLQHVEKLPGIPHYAQSRTLASLPPYVGRTFTSHTCTIASLRRQKQYVLFEEAREYHPENIE